MRSRKAYQAMILAALLFGGLCGTPTTEAAEQGIQEAVAEKQPESQAAVTDERKMIVLPKAPPSYSIGYFYDSIDARWETNKEFPYNPDNVYKIYCQPGYITDVTLHTGDTITYAGAGDTVQWVLDKAEANGAPHVYIKPVKQGISTNLVINTDRHRYQLFLVAGDWHLPMVSWSYKIEEAMFAQQKETKEKLREVKENKSASRWKKNMLYEIKAQGKAPEWMPQKVYDDGEKTFIQFSDLSKTLPVLFIADKKQFKPANYRVKKNSFVVDGTFKKAALQTTDGIVWITNRAVDKDE